MLQELTIPEISARLQKLEEEVQSIKHMLTLGVPSVRDFEYSLRVNGQEVWRGSEPAEKMPEILREYPNTEISIDWHSEPFIMI